MKVRTIQSIQVYFTKKLKICIKVFQFKGILPSYRFVFCVCCLSIITLIFDSCVQHSDRVKRYFKDEVELSLGDTLYYFENDQKKPVTGMVVEYENGKLISEEYFLNGISKRSRRWYINGQISHEESDGISRGWYPNGQISYEDFVLYNGFMLDSNANGYNRSWFSNGKLKDEEYFEDGELVYFKIWFPNGKIHREHNFSFHRPDGLQKVYSRTGKLLGKAELIDGTGKMIIYFENGKKQEELNFVNGELNGVYRQWYKTGQLKLDCFYSNGHVQPLNGIYLRSYFNNGKIDREAMLENGEYRIISYNLKGEKYILESATYAERSRLLQEFSVLNEWRYTSHFPFLK